MKVLSVFILMIYFKITNYFNNINYNIYNSYSWITSNSNIYFSSNGNIGIGSTIPKEKIDINGNLNINGKIIPNSFNIYNLGSFNFKWKNLYTEWKNKIYYFDRWTTSKD